MQLSKKKTINDRVFVLSQKINNISLNNSLETNRKFQHLQVQCEDLQSELENYKNTFNQKLFDLKQNFIKIDKQLNHDYQLVDKMCFQKISVTESNIKELITYEAEERKNSNAKLMKLIEEECMMIRALIQTQKRTREEEGKNIQECLGTDLRQIDTKFQQVKFQWENKLQLLEKQFEGKCQEFTTKLNSHCDEHAETQTEFYMKLRDLVKRTKQQLTQQRERRQQTQQQILTLIEGMCERVLQHIK